MNNQALSAIMMKHAKVGLANEKPRLPPPMGKSGDSPVQVSLTASSKSS